MARRATKGDEDARLWGQVPDLSWAGRGPALLSPRALFLLLAAVWLALALPHVATLYSYHWDSSQFGRAVTHFDVARHQPQPPGYPLWVIATKCLTPLTGNTNAAQVVLAIAFTAAALLCFRSLAGWMLGDRVAVAATAALGFSPLVCLFAITPAVYSVDLCASCIVAWFAARLWCGRIRWAPAAFATTAILGGFRQSGAVFLLPLLVVSLARSWRKRPAYAVGGILAGAICWLAWNVPLAMLSGGFSALNALTRVQMMGTARNTSVFFGAPAAAHLRMIVGVTLTFSFALAALAPPVAGAFFTRRGARGTADTLPCWATPLFFAFWLAPNLAMLYFIHWGQPGYVLLSLPPLVLIAAWLARPVLRDWRWTVTIVAAALIACYFPYERFMNPAGPSNAFQLLRSSPRLAWLLESSQRELRKLIDTLPGRPEQKVIVCMLGRPEAPNIRTVTYDYSDVYWARAERGQVNVFSPHGGAQSAKWPERVRSVAFLCDGAGLPPEIRARAPGAQRLGGNQLYSFWAAPAK